MGMTLPGGRATPLVPLLTAAATTQNGSSAKVIAAGQGSYTVAVFSIEGISGDTVTFQGTADGTNWYSIMATNLTTGTEAATATADGIYRSTVLGLLEVRTALTRVGGTVTSMANMVA